MNRPAPLQTPLPGAALNRRRFLAVTAGGVAALALLPACGGDSDADPAGPADGGLPADLQVPELDLPAAELPLESLVDAYFGDAERDAVRSLGTVWAARFQDSPAALQAELTALLEITAGMTEVGDARAALVDAVHRDFVELRVESLRGWLLGITELRLCGLAASLGA